MPTDRLHWLALQTVQQCSAEHEEETVGIAAHQWPGAGR